MGSTTRWEHFDVPTLVRVPDYRFVWDGGWGVATTGVWRVSARVSALVLAATVGGGGATARSWGEAGVVAAEVGGWRGGRLVWSR